VSLRGLESDRECQGGIRRSRSPGERVMMCWVGTRIAAHDPLSHKTRVRSAVIRTSEGCNHDGKSKWTSWKFGFLGDYISRYWAKSKLILVGFKTPPAAICLSPSQPPDTPARTQPESLRPPRNSYGPVRWISLALCQTNISSASRVDTQRSRKSVSVQSDSSLSSSTHILPHRRRYLEHQILAS
jgi:hypothetical protein